MKSKIKLISIKEIKENPNNPRKLNKDKYQKLLKSIQDLPQMLEYRPIVVNSNMIVLGGNMRLKALKELKYKEVPIIIADELSEDQQKEFLIKDNLAYGQWDWDMIANEWDLPLLEDWGIDLPEIVDPEQFGDDFSLPEGDKPPFQQMTFTLADEQAVQIQNAIAEIKLTDEYKYAETMGNENSNGNALYLIIMQWAEQKK
jgi:hypothetical protein